MAGMCNYSVRSKYFTKMSESDEDDYYSEYE